MVKALRHQGHRKRSEKVRRRLDSFAVYLPKGRVFSQVVRVDREKLLGGRDQLSNVTTD